MRSMSTPNSSVMGSTDSHRGICGTSVTLSPAAELLFVEEFCKEKCGVEALEAVVDERWHYSAQHPGGGHESNQRQQRHGGQNLRAAYAYAAPHGATGEPARGQGQGDGEGWRAQEHEGAPLVDGVRADGDDEYYEHP